MLLTLSLGEAIGARQAGGRAEAGAGRAESQHHPHRALRSPPRPRPSPAAANASLCCLMRDCLAWDIYMYLSAEDNCCPQVFPLSCLKRKGAQL